MTCARQMMAGPKLCTPAPIPAPPSVPPGAWSQGANAEPLPTSPEPSQPSLLLPPGQMPQTTKKEKDLKPGLHKAYEVVWACRGFEPNGAHKNPMPNLWDQPNKVLAAVQTWVAGQASAAPLPYLVPERSTPPPTKLASSQGKAGPGCIASWQVPRVHVPDGLEPSSPEASPHASTESGMRGRSRGEPEGTARTRESSWESALPAPQPPVGLPLTRIPEKAERESLDGTESVMSWTSFQDPQPWRELE